jgi:hypothetical protein
MNSNVWYSRLLLTTSFLVFSVIAYAQTVVNPSGNTLTSADYSFEYFIGGIEITTLKDTTGVESYSMTPGVLLPAIKLTDPGSVIIDQPLNIYPNPTRNILNVVAQNDWIISYNVLGLDGTQKKSGLFFNNQINLGDLAPGIYFIKLFSASNKKYRLLKVIRQ